MTFKLPVYSDERAPIFIVACDAECVIVYCDTNQDASALARLGFVNAPGHGDQIALTRGVADDIEKANLLTTLRDMGIPFGHAPEGWPPSAVFELFRERKLVQGTYKQIFRAGPGVSIRITLDN
jgi:hypothetical protein